MSEIIHVDENEIIRDKVRRLDGLREILKPMSQDQILELSCICEHHAGKCSASGVEIYEIVELNDGTWLLENNEPLHKKETPIAAKTRAIIEAFKYIIENELDERWATKKK